MVLHLSTDDRDSTGPPPDTFPRIRTRGSPDPGFATLYPKVFQDEEVGS